MPYENTSNAMYLAATYQATTRLALTGDMTFIDSAADFDGRLDNENLGNYSDLDIQQIKVSAGFTYLFGRSMSVYGRYQYHKYNDREDSSLDGDYNLISFGVNYSF
jgi:predicted porin